MVDDRRTSQDDDAVDPRLARAVRELKRSDSVSREWRDGVLARIAADAPLRAPARPRRSSLVRWVPLGIAAVLCAGVGFARLGSARGGSRVRFSLAAPSARTVSLVGDFDGWNPTAIPMRLDEGRWVVDVRLPPGRHVFAYAVDGGLRVDPAAPRAVEDDFGVPSSVIVVSKQGRE